MIQEKKCTSLLRQVKKIKAIDLGKCFELREGMGSVINCIMKYLGDAVSICKEHRIHIQILWIVPAL